MSLRGAERRSNPESSGLLRRPAPRNDGYCLQFSGLFFFSLFCIACSVFACQVTDDAGNTVSLPHPAQRIISLAPDLTELLFASGAGERIVGVMAGSDYPPEARKIPLIGNYQALNIEAMLALHPDLIVAWSEGHAQQLNTLRKFSIPIYVSHIRHLLDIPSTLQRFGCLVGEEKKTHHLANQFLNRYWKLKKQYSRQKALSVFYEIASHPLMTVNRNSWMTDAITVCGGRNVFASADRTAFAVSVESVLKENPEVIIAYISSSEWQEQWQHWSSISAVQHHRLFSIDPDLIERAGPRILDGVEAICRVIS